MKRIADIFFWIAIVSALTAALYFAVKRQNHVYSLCYISAAMLLLLTKRKKNNSD